jgi:hypothetical protein
VNIDVHESVKIGTTVGIQFRDDRINCFDSQTGLSIKPEK